jgi:hypothetical protein
MRSSSISAYLLRQTQRTAQEIDEVAGIKKLVESPEMRPCVPEDCSREGNAMPRPLREATASNRENQDCVSDLKGRVNIDANGPADWRPTGYNSI